MKVGITGSTGFVGSYLVRDYGEKFNFVAPIIESPADLSKADYTFSDYSVESLKKIFDGCEAVIHLAAKVAKRNIDSMTMDNYIKNTLITANVFEACKQDGIKKIIHASSRAVFDWSDCKEKSFNETTMAHPQNPYGVSKVCDETLAAYYNEVYGMEIISFRMAEVCGLDLKRGMINAFWANALKMCIEKKTIPLYGTGDAKRDLLYVKDAVRAFIHALNQNDIKGIYNIGSGEITSNRAIAEEFCKVFDNDCGVEFFPEKEEWGTNGILDVNKAKIDMDFSTIYDLSAIIQDIKKEYDEHIIL